MDNPSTARSMLAATSSGRRDAIPDRARAQTADDPARQVEAATVRAALSSLQGSVPRAAREAAPAVPGRLPHADAGELERDVEARQRGPAALLEARPRQPPKGPRRRGLQRRLAPLEHPRREAL